MDQDYDRKFEEMKKYIPFLESMIKRLESTSGAPGSANPRQAQLDKIRSLRDLLLDKKKRLKFFFYYDFCFLQHVAEKFHFIIIYIYFIQLYYSVFV